MEPMTVAEAWKAHRAYLINVAYHVLGDVGDAEDAVQEAFVRFSGATGIVDERGWLTVVTGRLCIDALRSARARHETADGSADLDRREPLHARIEPDPADRITLDEAVSHALTEVLHRLSPGERVAFILHDVFAMPFDRIAEITGRTAPTCRQLARRARAKVANGDGDVERVTGGQHRDVIDGFISACAGGDLNALAAVLDPSVWGEAILLVEPPLPTQVNHGALDVAGNLLRFLGPGTTLVSAQSGAPTLLAFSDTTLFAVVRLTIEHDRVVSIAAVADPTAARP